MQNIGTHYIKTLQCWRENFLSNWAVIRKDFVDKHEDATDDDIEAFHRRWIVSINATPIWFTATYSVIAVLLRVL